MTPGSLALALALGGPPVTPSERGADFVEVAPPAAAAREVPAEAQAGPGEERGAGAADERAGAGEAGEASDDEGWDFDFDALGSGFSDQAKDLDAGASAPAKGAKGGAKAGAKGARGEGEAKAADTFAEDERQSVDQILGGSLRLTGAYLHFPDEPLVFPNGDDALGVAVGRITVDADAGRHVSFEVNGFVDLARSPLGSLGGAFTSAGATDSVYRTRYLRWTFWENGAIRGTMGLDRAATSVRAGPVKIDVGRFPVNYSVTGMFAANDFFAPFSATAVNRIYKPGVDALRVSVAAGMLATVDVVGVLGYDADGAPTWGRSAAFARAGLVAGGFEWGVLGGKLAERWAVGGSAQGDAGPIGLRAEFHVGFPDRDGKGHGDDDLPIYVRAVGGPNVAFAWHNASISAEYMLISDGATKASAYLDRAPEIYVDTVPYLARHYAAAAVGMDVVPILRAAAFGIVNANDGSGLAGLSLAYNVADESDLILGLFVPWGRGLRDVDPMAGTFALGSEFGLSPLLVYLESRVFF
ncbi:MAG: hypothetical protein H6711_13045 [Myxococcales bacterium]|nr:hypothetical protein [Myxococcales bacterium]